MTVSIIIPVLGEKWATEISLTMLKATITPETQIIIVDNGSKEPYTPIYNEEVLRLEENLGMAGAFEYALPYCKHDVVILAHNDFYFIERDPDVIIEKAFTDNPKLAIAGLFSSRGVVGNGGRYMTESRMAGLFEGKAENFPRGQAFRAHSNWMERRVVPASCLDAMCMVLRKSIVEKEGLPKGLPKHHWLDRIWPLFYIERGYDCSGIGILYDHFSGATSCKEEYFQDAKRWVEVNQVPVGEGESYDLQLYRAGEKLFVDTYAHKLPLIVVEDKQGNYIYRWNAF